MRSLGRRDHADGRGERGIHDHRPRAARAVHPDPRERKAAPQDLPVLGSGGRRGPPPGGPAPAPARPPPPPPPPPPSAGGPPPPHHPRPPPPPRRPQLHGPPQP